MGTPNKPYDTTCGKKLWHSRSVATCTCVVRTNPDDTSSLQVLAVRRGKKVTNSGKYCLPCGYLDWDETIHEAAAREIWEETNMRVKTDDLEYYQIDSDPSKELQNITIHFFVVVDYDCESFIPQDAGEVEQIIWIDVRDFDKYEWAFDHAARVESLIKNK